MNYPVPIRDHHANCFHACEPWWYTGQMTRLSRTFEDEVENVYAYTLDFVWYCQFHNLIFQIIVCMRVAGNIGK